ncbi:hypothetical protein [Lautropia mirabilis]|uniref:hypothetical protein n=1 Tax=Lautropia mirabilis TaxID=47671 RepID=UPI0028F0605C|nr:hypothetical protein [Lautropia mirabilis]
MNTQRVSGSKLALALAISAVLGACGGGGGGDSSTPVATNGSGSTTTSTPAATTPAATAPSTPATTPTATTPATNSPVATAPAVTAPANNAQTPFLVNRAMYEQMYRGCQTPFRSFDPATGAACAAGVYVGKDLSDGTTDCTVKLAKDGEVTFTVGDKVHVYKMTQLFRSVFLKLDVEGAPYLFSVHISGYSADDAAKKVHGFGMNVNAKDDGSTLPDEFEITYTYGDVLTADEKTVCKIPL